MINEVVTWKAIRNYVGDPNMTKDQAEDPFWEGAIEPLGKCHVDYTCFQAIREILGRNVVVSDEEDLEVGKVLVDKHHDPRTTNRCNMTMDDNGFTGVLTLKDPNSREAREVAIAVHEAYHAWIFIKTKGGMKTQDELLVNKLAKKWLERNLTGMDLHVAIEAINHSNVSYGHQNKLLAGDGSASAFENIRKRTKRKI